MRTSKPEKGNKYYIRKISGGYNGAIKGNPKDKDCDVLANCVGYVNGRAGEAQGLDKIKYQFTCNAENFIEKAEKYGLKISKKPVENGIMVWQKGTLKSSDGAGHVEYVEKVISDNEVYNSGSSYGKKAFYNVTRKNTNGRWGLGSSYKYRGCIVIPDVKVTKKTSFKIGDKVEPTKLETYDGKKLIQYDAHYYITDLKNDKAVLSAKRGNKYYIWATLNTKNIKKVG